MKPFITFLSLLAASVAGAYAQKTHEIEPALLECRYKHIVLLDTLDANSGRDDIMILRICQNVSQFFSRYTYYADSLWNDPTGQKLAGQLTLQAIRTRDHSKRPGSKTTCAYIYKNYPAGKISTYDMTATADHYLIEEDIPHFEWEMEDSVKTVCGYECQLATTTFRGRTYKAWFAPEIAISDGPWKLAGLPGLIMEAYDTKGHYRYTLTGIRQQDIAPVSFYNCWQAKFEKIDRIKYLRMISRRTKAEQNRIIKAKIGLDLGSGKEAKVEQGTLKPHDHHETDYH